MIRDFQREDGVFYKWERLQYLLSNGTMDSDGRQRREEGTRRIQCRVDMR